ncbi:MAG: magnesium transporter CorA family protein [Brevinematales bacterium]|nr:magnesium transporter CorA family protein [Brevinematales bacterium]
MITHFDLVNNKFLKRDKKTNIIHFYNITDEERETIINKYNIDEHSINSCLDADEVPRLEIEKDNINLIWKIPTTLKVGDKTSFDVISAGFFIRGSKLIIITSDKFPYVKDKFFIKKNTIYDIIIFFQYSTIKHFIEHLKAIKLISRSLQKKINESMDNEYLLNMFDLSEILIYYLDSINGNKSVLLKFYSFLKNENISYNEAFLKDLLNETDQASKQAEIYSQIFAGLMDARGTIVNNNMNLLIKNLTVINIIFLPLNLIASMGGMSEFSMMTQGIPWPISYSLFTLGMIIIGWITLVIINKSSSKK